MKVAVTGIGSMTTFAKGAQGWRSFRPDHLWDAPRQTDAAWFDPAIELGGRGFKYFNAATCYLLAAIKQFDVSDSAADSTSDSDAATPNAGDRRGVVVGSNSCTRQELDRIDQTVLEQGSAGIHPMRAPSFCANVGTGTVSIRTQAKAFNITLMNPITAGLEAVVLAKDAIAGGRAHEVIAGAMEDDAAFALGGSGNGSGVEVRTAGGAWALRLAAADASLADAAATSASSAWLGHSLNRFLPRRVAADAAALERWQRALADDVAPLLHDKRALTVCVATLTDPHSATVLHALRAVLQAHGVETAHVQVPTRDTQHGTVLALAQLSWLCTRPGHGLCVAISPVGHVTMLAVDSAVH